MQNKKYIAITPKVASPKRLYFNQPLSQIRDTVVVQFHDGCRLKFHKCELQLFYDAIIHFKERFSSVSFKKPSCVSVNPPPLYYLVKLRSDQALLFRELERLRAYIFDVMNADNTSAIPAMFLHNEVDIEDFNERIRQLQPILHQHFDMCNSTQNSDVDVHADSKEKIDDRPLYPVLSLDGGGFRGILTGLILSEIESFLPTKCFADTFKLMCGTSTGSILAGGLSIPDSKNPNVSKFTSDDLVKLYEDVSLAQKIFDTYDSNTTSPMGCHDQHELIKLIQNLPVLPSLIGADRIRNSVFHLLQPKFLGEGKQAVIGDYFEDFRLNECRNDVLFTSYSMKERRPVIFSSQSKLNTWGAPQDHLLRDAINASSAAPTYFPLHRYKTDYLADGGVFCNNPVLYALSAIPDNVKPLVISVGTGVYAPDADDWTAPTHLISKPVLTALAQKRKPTTNEIPSFYDVRTDGWKNAALTSAPIYWGLGLFEMWSYTTSDYQHDIATTMMSDPQSYFRLNPSLPSDIDMADITQKDLLTSIAKTFIRENRSVFSTIKESFANVE